MNAAIILDVYYGYRLESNPNEQAADENLAKIILAGWW